MHFLWSMYLFILVLFCLFSMDKADDEYPEDYEENDITIALIIPSRTTPSLDEYDTKKLKTIETTSIKQVTKHHGDPDVDYYDQSETEEEIDNPTKPIKTTSSFSPMKYLTSSITKTTTTEIPFTYPIWSSSNSNIQVSSTTIDPEKKAAFLAKTNRDRFYLKIFAISITVGMIILAGILITIHLVRKGRHYHGYDLPANKQSINV